MKITFMHFLHCNILISTSVNGSVATFSTETSEDGTEWVTAVRGEGLTASPHS